MDVKWYENFFHGIALDMWRKAVSPEKTRAEADFLERATEAATRGAGARCAVGSRTTRGRARLPGLSGDRSRPLRRRIREGRERATATGVIIEWKRADMRDLPWQSEFDGAFCFGNSFGYLDPAGNRAFVQAVARAIKPEARFALDSGMAAESILPNLRKREWMQIEDILFLEENRYHSTESC